MLSGFLHGRSDFHEHQDHEKNLKERIKHLLRRNDEPSARYPGSRFVAFDYSAAKSAVRILSAAVRQTKRNSS